MRNISGIFFARLCRARSRGGETAQPCCAKKERANTLRPHLQAFFHAPFCIVLRTMRFAAARCAAADAPAQFLPKTMHCIFRAPVVY